MGLPEELEQLEGQRASGELTDDEYEDAKAQLLAAHSPPPAPSPAGEPPPKRSPGTRALIVIAILVGLILVVPIVAIVAVTFLGGEASSRFSEVGGWLTPLAWS